MSLSAPLCPSHFPPASGWPIWEAGQTTLRVDVNCSKGSSHLYFTEQAFLVSWPPRDIFPWPISHPNKGTWVKGTLNSLLLDSLTERGRLGATSRKTSRKPGVTHGSAAGSGGVVMCWPGAPERAQWVWNTVINLALISASLNSTANGVASPISFAWVTQCLTMGWARFIPCRCNRSFMCP